MSDIREWRPTKRQEDFLSVPDSVFEVMFGGAAGGGKSESLLLLPIVREFYKNSDFKALILRRTYPELERELIIRSQEYYPPTGAVYNEAKKRWHWPSFGSYIQFGYAEHEKDVRAYDTAEYSLIEFDELTSFTEFQYKYLAFSRCRTKADSGLPAIVRSGTNPGNVGHGFVRSRFVEPAPHGYTIIKERFGDKHISRIYIPAKATDNPHVDPDYILRLQMLPEAERLAKLEGDWWTFTGQVFDDWRIMPFADEPANAQHVIRPFPVPDWWPRLLAIDWGFAAKLWAGWAAISPQRRIYLYHEYACTKTKISTWATDLKRITDFECPNGLVDLVLDPSAWHHRGDEQTIAEQFKQYFGREARKADNDRIGGKLLLQELLRWRPRPQTRNASGEEFDLEKAEWIRRNRGTGMYQEYVARFLPDTPEDNIPILQVFDTCEEFTKTIPLCVYNDITKPGLNKEDVAEFNGDDPYDGGRYLLKACIRYLDSAVSEGEARKEVEHACNNLDKTGDMTSFYIKMANIDARMSRRGRPLRRRRRYVRAH
jgi:hypothetical protein